MIKANTSNVLKPYFHTVRLTKNGSIDNSFGSLGHVYTYFESQYPNTLLFSVAIQKDNKIVVGGMLDFANNSFDVDPVLVRYNTDGSPDLSFGNNGIALAFHNNYRNEAIWSVDIQADNKIVCAGFASSYISTRFATFRFNKNGTPDSTFGTNGISINSLNPNPIGIEALTTIKVLNVNGFVAGGSKINPSQPLIQRYNSDGSLDLTFAGSGHLSEPQPGGLFRSLLVDNNNRIIGSGFGSTGMYSIRINANGTHDNLFGDNGIADLSTVDNKGVSSSCFQEAKILLTGSKKNTNEWQVVRINNTPANTSSIKEIILFPNPGPKFRLKFIGYNERVKINIYNAIGQLYKNQENEILDGAIIDVETQYLASAVYFISISTADGLVTKRFIKQ